MVQRKLMQDGCGGTQDGTLLGISFTDSSRKIFDTKRKRCADSFAHCVPFSFFFFCNQGARLVHSLLVLFFKPSGFVVFSFFVLLFFLFPPSSSLSLSPYGFTMFQSPVTSTRAPPSAAFCASASNGRLRLLRLLRTRFPRLRPLAPAPVPLPSFPCP